MTTSELAKIMGLSPNIIRRLAKQEKLVFIIINGRYCFDYEESMKWLWIK